MDRIASHEFDAARQQNDSGNGYPDRRDSYLNHLPVLFSSARTVSNADYGYYWTDEGYEHLRDGQDCGNHGSTLHIDIDGAERDAFLTALASHNTPLAISFAFLILALLGLVAATSMPRVERSYVIAERV